MKNITILVFLVIASSCSVNKKVIGTDTNLIQCLMLSPSNYHNVMINPEWISKHNVTRIIEREYLDGRNEKVHLVTVLDYNENGYVKTKYSGHGYPENDTPNEKDIFSKWEYQQEVINSFVYQTTQIIRFFDEATKRDTIQMGGRLFNPYKISEFKTEEEEVIWTYKYDNQGRLVSKTNKNGKELFSVVYHNENSIEIKEYSPLKNEYFSSWLTLADNGKIIKDYNESNLATHEFEYDELGRMIIDKHWFKGKEPNYHTYEYITKESR